MLRLWRISLRLRPLLRKPENGARAGGVLLTAMCAVAPRRMMLCVFH
jgi:hypothetical protein